MAVSPPRGFSSHYRASTTAARRLLFAATATSVFTRPFRAFLAFLLPFARSVTALLFCVSSLLCSVASASALGVSVWRRRLASSFARSQRLLPVFRLSRPCPRLLEAPSAAPRATTAVYVRTKFHDTERHRLGSRASALWPWSGQVVSAARGEN